LRDVPISAARFARRAFFFRWRSAFQRTLGLEPRPTARHFTGG
jgi:hypothetical protein